MNGLGEAQLLLVFVGSSGTQRSRDILFQFILAVIRSTSDHEVLAAGNNFISLGDFIGFL
jgi:hypothetical protein